MGEPAISRSARAQQWWRSSPQPRPARARQLIVAATRLLRQAAPTLAGGRLAVAVATAMVLGGAISWLLSGGGGRRSDTPLLPPRTTAVIESLRPLAGASSVRRTALGESDLAPASRSPNQGTLGRRRVDELNRRAIDAYEALDPRTAVRLLEQALRRSESLGPRGQDLVARTHANLGLVWAAGFKDRELAARHFRSARAVSPDITPPSALMTPEVEAALKASRLPSDTPAE
jgi:hypothetical protein